MHFSSALLVLASVFIVGSNALIMSVSYLRLFSSVYSFRYQGLTVADLVKQYQNLQAATEDLIEPRPRPPLLRSAQPAAAHRA